MLILKINDVTAPLMITKHDGHRMRFVGWNDLEDYGVPSAEVGCLNCQDGPFDVFADELIITLEG